MNEQGQPSPDKPFYGQHNPLELENRLTELKTTVDALPDGERVKALEVTMDNYRWFVGLLVGLCVPAAIALSAFVNWLISR